MQEWYSCFKTDGHTAAIQFRQDIFGKVGHQVHVHHTFSVVHRKCPQITVCEGRQMLGRFRNQIGRPHPLRHVIAMHGLWCCNFEELLDLAKPLVCQYIDPFDPLTNHSADNGRQSPEKSPAFNAEQIQLVATEKFIASVSGQADRDTLASQSRYQESWDLRRIGKRLIVDAGHQRDDVLCYIGRYAQLCVFRPQMLSDVFGVVCLVMTSLIETDGERFNG